MTYSQTLMEVEEKGIEKGVERGMLKALFGLVKDGVISEADAARRAGMSLENFTKAVLTL